MFYTWLLSTLLHLFFPSNSVVFVDGGRKNISCPWVQGTLATSLSRAGPILTSLRAGCKINAISKEFTYCSTTNCKNNGLCSAMF